MEEYEVEIEMDCGTLKLKLVAPYESSDRVLLAIAADIVADELGYAKLVSAKLMPSVNSRRRLPDER